MAGLGDLIVVVEDLATYQAAVNAGKTAPSVMYLILAERQVYFNSELWSKAPEEGGGGGNAATVEDLINDEHVAAKILNDHQTKITELYEVDASIGNGMAALLASLQSLTHRIEETEHVTAAALIDLNNRIL